MGDMIFNPWTGEWEVLNPSKSSTNTTAKKATGFDWLNAILTGAGNILGGLFPNGVNNGGSTNSGIPGGYFPGGYPTNQQSNTSQNDNMMYLLLGLVLVVLITRK